ncbi:MAG TPA: ATP-binding protein [Polyangiaceae bacterium]|nr:ATP-binding protein [Polyangiaceae bacterium]
MSVTQELSSFRRASMLGRLMPLLTGLGLTAVTGWLAVPLPFALGSGFAGGVVTAVLGFGFARLRQQDSEARDEAEVLSLIADSTPDAVLFFDDTGRIRYANPSARDLFFEGASPVGKNFLSLVKEAPAALREALLGDSERLFSIEVEGQFETFHVSRRTFEREQELHTLLVVKHLTREIARREVEVLKRVIRVISHEVNNSLAPVSSLVHSARKIAQGPTPENKLERVFQTIEERTRHLASFLEGYANLARLPDPKPRRVEWAGFFRQIAELHPGVSFASPPDQPGYFDAVQVEQVLINLLKNAVEAGSPRSGVEISARVDEAGDTELRVRDRGPGFSEEALRSALLPLYTTKERGSGMGLALCREIVEAHGGSIRLSNAPDGGGWVSLRLPGKPREPGRHLSRSRLTLTRSGQSQARN